MVRRLFLGLLLGLVIGAVVAAALIKGAGIYVFSSAFAYLAAAATGVLTGLVAGKPIWSADGKIEAGLKAFFGALLAAGAMFALRKWGGLAVDLSAIGAGAGRLGDLPATSLPLVAAVLGGFFELDNTGPVPDAAKPGANTRVAAGQGKSRVAVDDEGELDDVPAAPAANAKKKR